MRGLRRWVKVTSRRRKILPARVTFRPARPCYAQTRGHLEQLVAERTRELDEALLRERSAADLYRNFAGMISHQFRTPLAVADSALQRLIRRGDRASTAEIVDRAQLFDANFRGQNSVGTRGTGVGLFIARSLARMQGGDLQLRDTDRGTSFRFTLPRYEGEK